MIDARTTDTNIISRDGIRFKIVSKVILKILKSILWNTLWIPL